MNGPVGPVPNVPIRSLTNFPGEPQQIIAAPDEPYPGAKSQDRTIYASWTSRVLSHVIDEFVVFIPFLVLDWLTRPPAGETSLENLLVSAAMAVFWIWNVGYRQGATGRSLGKSAMGTRCIVDTTGNPTGFWLQIGRQLLHVVDGLLCALGFIWPIWDAKRQTFSDKIVQTVVLARREDDR